jgi:hypothetical protein
MRACMEAMPRVGTGRGSETMFEIYTDMWLRNHVDLV